MGVDGVGGQIGGFLIRESWNGLDGWLLCKRIDHVRNIRMSSDE